MEDSWSLVLLVVVVIWLLSILSFSIYFWLRVMPLLKQLREEPDGNVQLVKIFFPPKFHR
jgi:hypothetical protein